MSLSKKTKIAIGVFVVGVVGIAVSGYQLNSGGGFSRGANFDTIFEVTATEWRGGRLRTDVILAEWAVSSGRSSGTEIGIFRDSMGACINYRIEQLSEAKRKKIKVRTLAKTCLKQSKL